MRIKSIELKNFKRFTDLRIDHIPETAKLVLLIGSNGSGKSSVFDAFELVNSNSMSNVKYDYYRKDDDHNITVNIESNTSTYYTDENNSKRTLTQRAFYGRTSFRQTPKLERTQLGSISNKDYESDQDRPRFYIDRDIRFENDIEKISEQIVREVFIDKSTSAEIKNTFIHPINKALQNIFDSENNRLQLIEIIPPLDGNISQINFSKGKSVIHYNYLSAGEKEIVNVLFNLLARKDKFTDTVYFLDEIDLHLNTTIQYNLLKEITENWIPENCQLWTASHSLGFIDFAKQNEEAVIIDFDDLNFDIPQVLSPQPKENLELYEIAVPKNILFNILSGKRLIVCENQNDEYYNLLGLENTIFVGVKDARETFLHVKKDSRYHSLRDRDFLSDTEIIKIQEKYPNHHILKYYDFENYIYHPDNLEELNLKGFDKEVYINEILSQKREKMHYILATLVSSRQTYEEFKTNDKLRDEEVNGIVDDFKSNDFERFYKFFDMKKQFDKSKFAALLPSKEKLVQTSWFKAQIESCLS